MDRLAASISLGYGCIAHNVVVKGTLPRDHKCPIQLMDPKLSGHSQSEKFMELLEGKRQLQQLKRLTFVTDEVSQAQCLDSKNPVLAQYDLVAIQPMSTQVAEQACATLDIDLITVDLTKGLPFHYKQLWLQKAAERGIYIELCYSGALRDPRQRRAFFAGARKFYDWTRGKNLIMSSGADDGMQLRGPYDVINLATFTGFTAHNAKESISVRCAKIVRAAQERNSMFKGAVSIQAFPLDNFAGPDDVAEASADSMDVDLGSDAEQKDKKGTTSKKNNQQDGVKKRVKKKRTGEPRTGGVRRSKRLSAIRSQNNGAGY